MTKYAKEFKRIFSSYDYPAFKATDVALAFKAKNISNGYIRLMLHNYLISGEIVRITKGVYTFHKDLIVAGFAFTPFYYGLESALSIMGISMQQTNNVIITPRNVRQGTRTLFGRNYRIARINKRMFFGYEIVKFGNFWVPISNLEKTLIDMAYFKVTLRNELHEEIKKKIDRKRLNAYVKRCSHILGLKAQTLTPWL
ncbi:MAG: hypothetical protein QXN59_02120 [Candidatus Micrarchaeaceae archaeon]